LKYYKNGQYTCMHSCPHLFRQEKILLTPMSTWFMLFETWHYLISIIKALIVYKRKLFLFKTSCASCVKQNAPIRNVLSGTNQYNIQKFKLIYFNNFYTLHYYKLNWRIRRENVSSSIMANITICFELRMMYDSSL